MLTYVPIVFSFFGEFSQPDGEKKAPGESNKGIFQIFFKKFAICWTKNLDVASSRQSLPVGR